MPQFFISVNHSDDFQMPEGVSIEQLHTDVMAFNEKMAAEQRIVFVGALEQPASDARLVDATSGEALVAQETASGAEIQLGGFWILEAADLDEALNLGAQASRFSASSRLMNTTRFPPRMGGVMVDTRTPATSTSVCERSSSREPAAVAPRRRSSGA